MFGLLYISEENQQKLNQVTKWQDRFLQRVRKDQQYETKQSSKTKS